MISPLQGSKPGPRAVSWTAFEQLPGAATSNFEMLCRGLIRRHYGRFGDFVARAAQPGVEFHLKLHSACGLGAPGRWYGWQCRWWDLPRGRPITASRRKKIVRSITTTEKELPGITDWILWTRHPLTKADQRWFYDINTHMRLIMWTAAEVLEHLSGDAEILRGTYFGELVLTPERLVGLYAESLAPSKRRWQPQLHQPVEVERAIARMLGNSAAWVDLHNLSDRLRGGAAAVVEDERGLPTDLKEDVRGVGDLAITTANWLLTIEIAVKGGDLDLLRQELSNKPPEPPSEFLSLPRRLRSGRYRAALSVTTTIADVQLARELGVQVETSIGGRLIAVVADAGCGKTDLSMAVTAPTDSGPAGILLAGRNLHAGHDLNDLARRVVLAGNAVPSMEALIAALDAAGQRAQKRLPLVIDGLNESEDPRDWKSPLAALETTLEQYPYVLVICTLRSSFVDEAIPPDLPRLVIPDFGHDTIDAIRRYFAYYRIDPADAELPWNLLRHPLTLRLFCDVTNPKRLETVGIEATPSSLTALFDRYLDQASERIAELSPRSHRYYQQDVRSALDLIGQMLWEQGSRTLDMAVLRKRLGDDTRPWDQSMVRALEEDGVLIRVSGGPAGKATYAATYDPLGGHLVADAVVSRHGRDGLRTWLRERPTIVALEGRAGKGHPLASDTFGALVAIAPRRLHGEQLWSLLSEPLRGTAIRLAAGLEPAYLDTDTVAQLQLLAATREGLNALAGQLLRTRGAPTSPLNAEFLEAILKPMPVAERDAAWTEWIRGSSDRVLTDLKYLEDRWRRKSSRPQSERLRARWAMWTLTSTVRMLRDQATRALYWFGRGDPAALFELTLSSLSINDPYVPERMLAASYGVTMANQLPNPDFVAALGPYLVGLREALTGTQARQPTSHWLSRSYVRGTVQQALTSYPEAVPSKLIVNGRVPFVQGFRIDPMPADDPDSDEVNRAIRMDFENYTIGRLFDDRSNYDMGHQGHLRAMAHVRGAIWTLGWRRNGLGLIDDDSDSHGPSRDGARSERYGKKYGWIGFYTFAGILDDERRLPTSEGRLSDVDIDPSFPDPPPTSPIAIPAWARPTPKNDRDWIKRGLIRIPDRMLYSRDLGDLAGPWIAVQGQIHTEGQAIGRRVFGLLTALLVSVEHSERLINGLARRSRPARFWLPEPPSDYYTYAGEIPWSPDFAAGDRTSVDSDFYTHTVTVENEPPIEVEILAHDFRWESYHSELNAAGSALLPSKRFSARFGLRGLPQTFNQVMSDGGVAAVSLSAPNGFGGNMLYLREDLVYRYAAGRTLIWFIWGERQLHPPIHPTPDWLQQVYEGASEVWRRTRRGDELSPLFAIAKTAKQRGTAR